MENETLHFHSAQFSKMQYKILNLTPKRKFKFLCHYLLLCVTAMSREVRIKNSNYSQAPPTQAQIVGSILFHIQFNGRFTIRLSSN